jgi:hypothetical protein
MNSPHLPFCCAKTCSTAQRTEDLRAFASAVAGGTALPAAAAYDESG